MGEKLAQLFLFLLLTEEKAAKKKTILNCQMQWCVRFSCDVFSEEEKENRVIGGDSKERKMQVVKIAFEMTCAQ